MLRINCKAHTAAYQNNDIADRYFADIRRIKTLTDNEQKELLYIIKKGKTDDALRARHRLIECNQRLIASIAKHRSNEENFNDLISEGTLGLNRAIDKFDLSYQQQFITYAAFWIIKYMADYLVNTEKSVVTKNAVKANTYLNPTKNRFFLKNGRYPTIDEVQAILAEQGVVFANKTDLMEPWILSIDEIETIDKESDILSGNLMEYNECTATNNVEEYIEQEHASTITTDCMSVLNKEEEYVVKHYFGIGCEQEEPSVIANKLGIEARYVVREIERALKKMCKKVKFLKKG